MKRKFVQLMSVLLLLVGLCNVTNAEDHHIVIAGGQKKGVNEDMLNTLVW